MTSNSRRLRSATPLMYGYIRSSLERPEYVAACRETLEQWCARAGWNLGGVFTDVGGSLDSVDRIGFRGLLDALGLPNAAGVVLVDGAHLSPRPEIVTSLARQIRRTGASILVMDGELPPEAMKLCQGQREFSR